MRGKVVSENAYALVISILKDIEPEEALKEMEIKARSKPWGLRGTTIKESEKQKVYDYYYKEDMSLTAIAKIYDVSRYTVKYYMDKVGIPSKSRGRYAK